MYRNPLYKHETEKVVNNLIYAVSLKENANDFCTGSAGIRVSVLVSIAPCHRAREISLVSSDFKGTGL